MKSVIKHLTLFIASVFFSFTVMAADNTTETQSETVSYTITILDPTEGTTFQNQTTTIPVTFSISPALQKSHKVQLIVDGQPDLSQPTGNFNPSKMTINISKLERGSHTVQVKIMDKDKKLLGTSTPITIHQQRSSKLLPPH